MTRAAHKRLLAAFETAANASDEQREAALLRLGQLQAHHREDRDHARA